jgi:cytochrome bd-type quinol oxidase subunit 2
MNKKIIIIVSLFLVFLVLPSLASAEWNISNVSGYGLPGEGYTVGDVLVNLLQWVLGIFGILAVLAFIISGAMYFTATGDTTKAENAKKNMMYAIIGVIVGLGGVVIIQTIENALEGTLSPF